jgi:hypothetical protein
VAIRAGKMRFAAAEIDGPLQDHPDKWIKWICRPISESAVTVATSRCGRVRLSVWERECEREGEGEREREPWAVGGGR